MTFQVGDRVRITVDDLGPFKKGDEAVLVSNPNLPYSIFPFRAKKLDSADKCPVALDEIETVAMSDDFPDHTSPMSTCKACNPITPNKEGTPPVTDTKRRQVVAKNYKPGDSIYEVVAEDGGELWVKVVGGRYVNEDNDHRYTVPAWNNKDYVPQPVKGDQWQGNYSASTVTVVGVLDDVVVYHWDTTGDEPQPFARSIEEFTRTFTKVG